MFLIYRIPLTPSPKDPGNSSFTSRKKYFKIRQAGWGGGGGGRLLSPALVSHPLSPAQQT